MGKVTVMRSDLGNRTRVVVARAVALAGLCIIATVGPACVAKAESIRVVALGASVTAGKGVGPSYAWPALLEGKLRARGYDASVTVNAISGDTSSGILSRVDSAVVPGTQVVVFDLGSANDRKIGKTRAETEATGAQIASRIRAHGARPIRAPYMGLPRLPDRTHLTAAAHAQVAALLVPRVIATAHAR